MNRTLFWARALLVLSLLSCNNVPAAVTIEACVQACGAAGVQSVTGWGCMPFTTAPPGSCICNTGK